MSLIVEWQHIERFCPRLCDWVTLVPAQVLGTFDEVATRITLRMYPKLHSGKTTAVRISSHPAVGSIRNLNTSHLNKFVVIQGVCMRRSDVLPRLEVVWFECTKCKFDGNGPFDQRMIENAKLKRKY